MEKRGGARPGAGRKPVAEEKKVTGLIIEALKQIHNVDTEQEAKVEFIKKLYDTPRGQIFLAEHLYGKPKETVDQTVTINDFSIKDIVKFK